MEAMGRRALRTGVLVCPRSSVVVALWNEPDPWCPSQGGTLILDEFVATFSLGLVLATTYSAPKAKSSKKMKTRQRMMTLVLDCKSMKVGWCKRALIVRVK